MDLATLARSFEAMRDKERLDFLGDPKMEFRYSIAADGRAHVTFPLRFTGKSLREAIDYVLDNRGKWMVG